MVNGCVQTYGATDWEYFRIRNDHYLAVVNAVNFGPHATTSGIQQQQQFITNSTIYRFNGLRKAFEKYQDLVTYRSVVTAIEVPQCRRTKQPPFL